MQFSFSVQMLELFLFQPSYVGKVIHAAKIEVNEEGTEAAAATAIVNLFRSRTPVFRVDKPFFFVIRDNVYRVPIFMGRVVDPADQERTLKARP